MRTRAVSATNQTPILTLVCPTAASWNVEPKTFENLACAAVAIVDRLEDAGFRVEVIAGRRESSSYEGMDLGTNNAAGHRSEMYFRVKAAEDHLDLARAVYAMGHPSVHRRILFAACAIHPGFRASIEGHQGFAVAIGKVEAPPGTYILPALRELHSRKADALATFDHCIASLKAQACPGLE